MSEEKKEGMFRLNPKYASASTIQLANSAYAAGVAFRRCCGYDDEDFQCASGPNVTEASFGFLLGYASAVFEVEHERRVRETLRNARPSKGYGELV